MWRTCLVLALLDNAEVEPELAVNYLDDGVAAEQHRACATLARVGTGHFVSWSRNEPCKPVHTQRARTHRSSGDAIVQEADADRI